MSAKPPRHLLPGIYAFAPNRATLGGTAYLLVRKDQENSANNLLIDAPAHDPDLLQFIADQGGVQQWIITHRGGSGEAKALQSALNCDVWVQEQEAYLLPDLPKLQTFRDRCDLGSDAEAIWTPGYSPGSCCIYVAQHGGVLFTGRHLLPDRDGQLKPLRFAKTFHWPRQLRQVQQLQARFTPDTLAFACPAANTGFLRGQYLVKDAYTQLDAIEPQPLMNAPALL